MSDRVDLLEFIGAFVVEAEEIVGSANAALLEIEVANGEGTVRPRAVRELFRALHTIKGLAGMVGVEPIVEIAHALEGLVRIADRTGGSLGRAAVEVSLQAVHAISERVRAVSDHRPVLPAPARLLEAIAATDAAGDAPSAALPISGEWKDRLTPSESQQLAQALHGEVPVWTFSFTPSPGNAARGITITSVRAGLAAIGEVVKVRPRAIELPDQAAGVTFDILVITPADRDAIARIAATTPDQVSAVRPELDTQAGPITEVLDTIEAEHHVSSGGRAMVRVELSRLDDLQDQLSLLIVSRFRIEREIAALAEAGVDVRRLREIALLQGRQLRDLRRVILRARMVPVSEVLEPLNLLVRSLARTSQRAVQLVLDAGYHELDKAVADRLLPALIHLVRNAIDHGLETPEQRMAIDKPRSGTVRVSCREVAGNHIELVVSDDGRGIDTAAIARRAKRPIRSDADLLEVLLAPGFSTRDVASTTSGRGLGMDIVKRITAGDLGGTVTMTTKLGVGTSFTLRVPVTIAVMDVLSFQCGPQAFVVPASLIDEIFEIEADAIVAPPGRSQGTRSPFSMVERRGHAIPVVSLGAILQIDSGDGARKALVISDKGQAMAFTVNRMLGRQEVVVRTIDDPLVNMPGIAGSTDLGDGLPTLVLDLTELGLIARERWAS